MSTVIDEFFQRQRAEIITYRRADIAARVLAGLAASGRITTAAQAADSAVELTDALIERLEKVPDPEPPKRYPPASRTKTWMEVCPKCGSKRCPRASNPSNPCEKETP